MYKDILDKCNSNKSGYFIKESGFKKTWPHLYKKIIEYPFTDELVNREFKIRAWHYLNQIFEIPKKECGNLLSFKNFNIGYSNFCSSNCKCMAKHSTDKKRNNNLLKYGVDHPMKLEENREKLRQTKLSYSDEKKCEINEKRKSSYLKKYGVDNPSKSKEILEKRINTFKSNSKKFKESYKKTSLERYGTEHPWANEIVRKTYKASMIKKYGEDNPLKVNSIKNRIKNTNNLKYGCDYTVQSSIIKEKIKNTLLEKYGVDNPSHIQEVKEKISIGVKNAIKRKLIKKYPNIILFNDDMKTLRIKCEGSCVCGGSFEIPNGLYFQRIKYNVTPCIHKNPINKIGITQSYLFDFILSLNVNAIKNDRLVLNGKEIDIFIPDYNLGLEFNGVYWHSELFKDKNYHQHKINLAKINNVDLFHIWEDDWLYKRPIVESMIRSKLGMSNKIGARKCQIKKVSPSDSKKFLEENHLQGNVNASTRIGLYHNDELVSLMTLGRLRKSLNQQHKDNEWELYRFASKLNTNVQGGFTRLLNYFINNYTPNKIHTYASLDHSLGDVYIKSGFTIDHVSAPGYWWVVDGIKQHRYNFTKQKLIKEGEDPNKTEAQIMYDRGSYRVWDSGNLKFTLNLKT